MGAYSGPDISENGLVLALDASNKKSYSQNEFQYSTDIYSWTTSGTRATLSRDTISSPVGNTPLKMEVTGNDPYTNTYNSSTWNIAPAANGQTWIVSVYVKASVATTGQIFIFGANSAGTGFVGGSWLAISAVTVNITTEWTRVSHYITMANADIAYIHTRLDGPDSGGTGQTVWWDGLQVERVPSGTTTPTPFTSAYYGGSVYRDLVGSNNGTLTNGLSYNGSNGGSLIFDGVDDYVELSTITLLRASSTISAWINIDDFTTGKTSTGRVFIRRTGFNFNSLIGFYNGGYSFETGTNSDPHEIAGRTTGNVSSSAISAGSWFHFSLVFDSNTFYGYVNGVLTGSASLSNDLSFNRIGDGSEFADNYPAYMKGKISNFTVYNRALTAQEIQQNYIATKSRFGL